MLPKICIAGKNNIAVNALEYLLNDLKISSKYIIVIPNKTDNGIDGWQKSLIKAANKYGIKICQLEDIYNIEDLIFISLEFDRLIKTEKFKTKRLFNIHFSLLPKYKGVYTSTMPILNGETQSGVTLHCIDNGIDTGDIIAQKTFNIDLSDTARDLYFKYLNNSLILFKENISNIISNNYTVHKQEAINSSYYSKQSVNFKNINIDFNKTSWEIYNQIRAYIFNEYQYPTINSFKICKVKLTDEKINKCSLYENEREFIISGIDCFKLIAYKKLKNDASFTPPR